MFIKRTLIFTFLSFFAFIFMYGCEKSYKVASGYQAERLMADNGSFKEITVNGMVNNRSGKVSWRQTAGKEVELLDADTLTPRFTPRKGDIYKFELTVGEGKKLTRGLMTVEVINHAGIYIDYPIRGKYISVNVPVVTYKGIYEEIKSIYALNKTTGAKFNAVMNNGSFTIPDISLALGDNVIDIVATDLAGYKITKPMMAVFNRKVRFASSPTFGNNRFTDDEDVVTSVSIEISDYAGMKPGQVRLLQVDDNYTIIKDNIAILYDNGDVTNGDDIAQDGVYSSKVVFEKIPADIYKFRIAVDYGETEYSAPAEVESLVPVDVRAYNENSKLVDEIREKYTVKGSGWFESYLLNISRIVDELFLYPQVVNVSVSDDCRTFNVSFSDGTDFPTIVVNMKNGEYVKYDFKKNNFDQKKICGFDRYNPNAVGPVKKASTFPGRISDGKGLNLSAQQSPVSEDKPALGRPLSERELKEQELNKGREILRQPTIDGYPPEAVNGKQSLVSPEYLNRFGNNNQEQVAIGSHKLLGLAPFAKEFSIYDSAAGNSGAYSALKKSKTPRFASIGPLINEDVTVHSFKNLNKFGAVILSSHGGVFFKKNLVLKDGTVINALGEPWIITGEEFSDDKLYGLYNKDVKDQMIYKGGVLEEGNAKHYFAIRPAFFNKYSRGMPNTIIYLASCLLFYNEKLYNSLLNSGAKAVIGFDDSAEIGYMNNIGATFFKSMTEGKNVEEAYNEATEKHGAVHSGARFKYSGMKNLVLEYNGIINGGFEQKLTAWETAGDVRPIQKLGIATAKEGNNMAIISTGLGSVSDADSSVSQTFKIPLYAKTLSFKYNIISEEPMEYVGSGFDDKFQATLTNEMGDDSTLAYVTVNNASWTGFGGDIFSGGDATTYQTGWNIIEKDVSSLVGKSVTLTFHVWDVGDSAYDTAALIDDVKLY